MVDRSGVVVAPIVCEVLCAQAVKLEIAHPVADFPRVIAARAKNRLILNENAQEPLAVSFTGFPLPFTLLAHGMFTRCIGLNDREADWGRRHRIDSKKFGWFCS